MLGSHVGEKTKQNKTVTSTSHYTQNWFKMASKLKYNGENVKFLGENRRVSLNPGTGKDFLGKTQKALTIKEKQWSDRLSIFQFFPQKV